MNYQTSHRRQDLPVRLGNHGYRLDGDYAWLNAELHVPPYSSGNLGLELWACSAPLAQDADPEAVQGIKVAEISLELPTPIGPHLHRVEERAPVSLPFGNGDHAMVLRLVDRGGEPGRVHDFANYDQLQRFASPTFGGAVGYALDGEQVVLRADTVLNPRPEGSSTGTLSVELWALSEPYSGGSPRGHRLAGAELGSIWGQYQLAGIERRAGFTAPPAGRWHVALLLREWTLTNGYVTRDYRSFEVTYEQAAAQPAPAPAPPTAANAGSAEKLRLVKPAGANGDVVVSAVQAAPAPAAVSPAAMAAPSAAKAPAAVAAPAPAKAPVSPAAVAAPGAAKAPAAVAAPAPAKAPVSPAAVAAPGAAKDAAAPPPAAAPTAPVATGTRLVSIQTASLEELAKLPGLSLKVAKEIVKNRPFASVDALVEVRGIGEKTLRRIKSLLTL